MPHNLDLILTLAGGLGVALILGFATQKVGLSPIVGYLLAGVVVGPFTPGFVAHGGIAEQLAELGVILLMFGVGLHFHASELMAVKRVAIPGAIAQTAVATALGVLVTWWAGWSLSAGVVFGLAIGVASTVVLLRVLADNDALQTSAGHVAVGWLLVEDLFTVLVLVMLPAIVGHDASQGASEVVLPIAIAVLKIVALVGFTMVVGRWAIPRLLGFVARTRSRELFTLTVLVLALGIAVGAAIVFGASMALGAFLAGMVVGQSEFSSRAASEALPMRDAFAVLFFVAMGMLFDPSELIPNAGLIAGTLAVILIGKPLIALVVVLLLRYPARVAATVAVVLAQIGEFSFILATLGRQLEVLPPQATQALVAAAVVSITLNPLLFRFVEPMTRWLSRWQARPDEGGRVELQVDPARRTVIIGYGPVGRTLATLLRDNGFVPTVIELNHETVNNLREQGIAAIYGDASQTEILERAGIAGARSLVFSASGASEAVIRAAKELNPDIIVIARSTYLAEAPALISAGAALVVSAEGAVALSMAERLLKGLGATAEQLDRARDRVRAELALS